MKKKEMLEFLENYDDDDIVGCVMWSNHSEDYSRPVDTIHRMRLPKRTEFQHEECENYQLIDVNGKKRGYCNYKEDFIKQYYYFDSCDHFSHKNRRIKYCLECKSCSWMEKIGCEGLKRRGGVNNG